MNATPIQALVNQNIQELARIKQRIDAEDKGTVRHLAEISLLVVATFSAYSTLFTLRLLKKLA
jgi:hypothetical protein